VRVWLCRALSGALAWMGRQRRVWSTYSRRAGGIDAANRIRNAADGGDKLAGMTNEGAKLKTFETSRKVGLQSCGCADADGRKLTGSRPISRCVNGLDRTD
jgi:hypothetical protein